MPDIENDPALQDIALQALTNIHKPDAGGLAATDTPSDSVPSSSHDAPPPPQPLPSQPPPAAPNGMQDVKVGGLTISVTPDQAQAWEQEQAHLRAQEGAFHREIAAERSARQNLSSQVAQLTGELQTRQAAPAPQGASAIDQRDAEFDARAQKFKENFGDDDGSKLMLDLRDRINELKSHISQGGVDESVKQELNYLRQEVGANTAAETNRRSEAWIAQQVQAIPLLQTDEQKIAAIQHFRAAQQSELYPVDNLGIPLQGEGLRPDLAEYRYGDWLNRAVNQVLVETHQAEAQTNNEGLGTPYPIAPSGSADMTGGAPNRDSKVMIREQILGGTRVPGSRDYLENQPDNPPPIDYEDFQG